jgi:hypothetical protein
MQIYSIPFAAGPVSRFLIFHFKKEVSAMKILMSFFGFFVLAFLVTGGAHSQVAFYANFEDPDQFYEFSVGSPNPPVFEFDYTNDVPAMGQGGCLHITATGNDWIGGLLWTDMQLTAGITYEVNAAFKHLSGSINSGFWCELYMSLEEPVDGADYKPEGGSNSDILISFNSWSGCGGEGVDGTFKDDACAGQNTTLYTVPGTAGETVTVYFGLKCGAGWGTWTLPYEFEILIDELTVTDVTTSVQNNGLRMPDSHVVLQNYPNPFNPGTTISFYLPVMDRVSVQVFNTLGECIATPVERQIQAPGPHEVAFNAGNLPGGVYIMRLSGLNTITKKIMLLK